MDDQNLSMSFVKLKTLQWPLRHTVWQSGPSIQKEDASAVISAPIMASIHTTESIHSSLQPSVHTSLGHCITQSFCISSQSSNQTSGLHGTINSHSSQITPSSSVTLLTHPPGWLSRWQPICSFLHSTALLITRSLSEAILTLGQYSSRPYQHLLTIIPRVHILSSFLSYSLSACLHRQFPRHVAFEERPLCSSGG